MLDLVIARDPFLAPFNAAEASIPSQYDPVDDRCVSGVGVQSLLLGEQVKHHFIIDHVLAVALFLVFPHFIEDNGDVIDGSTPRVLQSVRSGSASV